MSITRLLCVLLVGLTVLNQHQVTAQRTTGPERLAPNPDAPGAESDLLDQLTYINHHLAAVNVYRSQICKQWVDTAKCEETYGKHYCRYLRKIAECDNHYDRLTKRPKLAKCGVYGEHPDDSLRRIENTLQRIELTVVACNRTRRASRTKRSSDDNDDDDDDDEKPYWSVGRIVTLVIIDAASACIVYILGLLYVRNVDKQDTDKQYQRWKKDQSRKTMTDVVRFRHRWNQEKGAALRDRWIEKSEGRPSHQVDEVASHDRHESLEGLKSLKSLESFEGLESLASLKSLEHLEGVESEQPRASHESEKSRGSRESAEWESREGSESDEFDVAIS